MVAAHIGGTPKEIENYRPVSLTCILCKCFERLAGELVSKYLKKYLLRVDRSIDSPRRDRVSRTC